MDWKGMLSKIAPMAATAIGGPFGAMAASALLTTLGIVPEKGNEEEAWDLFSKAENLLSEIGIPFDTGLVRLLFARSLKKAGRDDEARVKFTRAINAFQEAGSKAMIQKAKAERDS